jgi:hypothetical protein
MTGPVGDPRAFVDGGGEEASVFPRCLHSAYKFQKVDTESVLKFLILLVPRSGIVEFSVFNPLAFPNFSKSHNELHRVFRKIPKLAASSPRCSGLTKMQSTRAESMPSKIQQIGSRFLRQAEGGPFWSARQGLLFRDKLNCKPNR